MIKHLNCHFVPIIRIISAKRKFHSIHQFSRYWLKTEKKTFIFHLSRAITLTRSHLTTLVVADFCRPCNKDYFSYWKNLAKPNGFGDICKTTTVWSLCYIYSNGSHVFQRIKNPHISSMQDTPWNIQTKFNSSWSSSVEIEVEKFLTTRWAKNIILE